MLNIREFVKGKDEEVWLTIRNEAFKEYDDFRPGTMEDMEIWEKDPGFDSVGMFIVELNGKAVGRVQAYVDKQRKEKKGFIQGLGVVPKFRRRGIGRKLMDRAIESLRERGMETAECWTRDDKPICKHIFESMGFKLIRVFSTMRRNLDAIPSDIGGNEDVEIRPIRKGMSDIKLLNWLGNETFKEHFDFRPATIEETRYWIEKKPWCDIIGFFFASLNDKTVGYVGAGIDTKFVRHKGIKRGWIMDIGVLKTQRRRGIGTALMLSGMKFLESKGMTEVELGVDDSNLTKAIELYKKVGFKVIRKDLTYLKKIA